MCEAIGHRVLGLSRIQFGPLRDPRLGPGAFRELTAGEIAKLRVSAGLS
jgi:16S rRNA U516 pseudouridylate synthase RsuA-like enzyme